MADHDNNRERFLALTEVLLGAWDFLSALLTDLPIPVIIPDLVEIIDQDGDPTEALVALHRVRQVIEDEPVAEQHKRCLVNMTLDWFTAYEVLGLVQMAGPAPWRLDLAEVALERFMTWTEILDEIEGEPGDDKS
ncbi:hypothetical protein AB0465_11335 [Streptomyces griseoviridis]|uniref:hypothetical protein n=1 Tax=Streptomyces griseoviridis TaxID=45398 RepID=UPI00344D7626